MRIFAGPSGAPWYSTTHGGRRFKTYLVIHGDANAFFVDADTLEQVPEYRPGYECDSLEELTMRGQEISPDTMLYGTISAHVWPTHLQVPEGL